MALRCYADSYRRTFLPFPAARATRRALFACLERDATALSEALPLCGCRRSAFLTPKAREPRPVSGAPDFAARARRILVLSRRCPWKHPEPPFMPCLDVK